MVIGALVSGYDILHIWESSDPQTGKATSCKAGLEEGSGLDPGCSVISLLLGSDDVAGLRCLVISMWLETVMCGLYIPRGEPESRFPWFWTKACQSAVEKFTVFREELLEHCCWPLAEGSIWTPGRKCPVL
jgi:hypothetical protein